MSVQLTNSTIDGCTLAMTGSLNLFTASVTNLNGVSLSIGSGSQFNVTAGANTTLAGGSFTNNGTIVIASQRRKRHYDFDAQRQPDAGERVLEPPVAQPSTSSSGVLTEPAGNTISGFGTINAALINQGLVNANVNGQTLTLATNPMTNTGTMETSNSGVLDIATSLNNSGGTIQSSGGGSIQITSGTLSNTGGTIHDANELTLFSSGTGAATAISANQNATVNANLALGSNQTWTIASGKTLTVGETSWDQFADRGGQRHAGPQRHEYL